MAMNAMQMMPLAYSFQTLCYLNDSQNCSLTQKAELCKTVKVMHMLFQVRSLYQPKW